MDLTWTEYLNSKAEKLDMSTRTLRDKLAGFKLGLKGGKPASSVNRKPKQISAGTIPAGISQTQIDAQAKLNVAKATLADAHKQLDKTIAGGDINGQAAAVLAKHESDVAEAEIEAGVTTREIEIESEIVTVDWKSILVNLLATLKADKAAQHLGKKSKAAIAGAESLLAPSPEPPAPTEEHRSEAIEYATRFAVNALNSMKKAKRGRKPRIDVEPVPGRPFVPDKATEEALFEAALEAAHPDL